MKYFIALTFTAIFLVSCTKNEDELNSSFLEKVDKSGYQKEFEGYSKYLFFSDTQLFFRYVLKDSIPGDLCLTFGEGNNYYSADEAYFEVTITSHLENRLILNISGLDPSRPNFSMPQQNVTVEFILSNGGESLEYNVYDMLNNLTYSETYVTSSKKSEEFDNCYD